MKIKEGYLLRKVADCFVAVSVGGNSDKRVIRMNATGAFLWETAANGAEEKDLADALIKRYSIDEQTAQKAVSEFVEKLRKEDLLA